MTAPAMPQNNPLALIATLSEIKDRRRAMDIQEEQLKQSASQFAQSLGVTQDSEKYKRIVDAVKNITNADLKSRPAYEELASTLGLTAPQMQALEHLGTSSPQTLEALRTVAANQGAQNLQGTPQGTAAQNDAYTAATSGQNQGAVAGSAMQALAQGGAANTFQQMTPADQGNMLRQMLAKSLTGQTVSQNAVDTGIANSPAAIQKLVATQSGQDQTAAQAANTAVGQGSNAAQIYATNAQLLMKGQELSTQLITNKAMMGYVSPADRLQGLQHLMDNAKQQTATPNSNDRAGLQAIYNHIATIIGMPELASSDPYQEVGLVSKVLGSMGAPQTVASPANPVAAMAAPTLPNVPTTPSPIVPQGQQPLPNPMAPLVRPPQ